LGTETNLAGYLKPTNVAQNKLQTHQIQVEKMTKRFCFSHGKSAMYYNLYSTDEKATSPALLCTKQGGEETPFSLLVTS
jgi:hypothetical protein